MSCISPFKPAYQTYLWGKSGSCSTVFQLLQSSLLVPDLNSKDKYAELWMGDHPSGPCFLPNGKRVSTFAEFNFLFKVLSIAKPLSLQVHPGLKDARQLHAIDSVTYKTPTPKPEMGLFLTQGTAIYGIRTYSEIIGYLNSIRPFSSVCHKTKSRFIENPSPTTLKHLVHEILTTKKEYLSFQIKELMKTNLHNETQHAINLIYKHFPDDPGCFFPFILNVVTGKPGQALFIPDSTLHAYLEGDLMEIMTLSDNVVRAAMTPKMVDIDTLLRITNFQPRNPWIIKPKNINYSHLSYIPPIPDFCIDLITLNEKESMVTSFPKNCICITVSGECEFNGIRFSKGVPIAVKAGTSIKMTALQKCSVYVGH